VGAESSFYLPLPALPCINVLRSDFDFPKIKNLESSQIEYFGNASSILDQTWYNNAKAIGIDVATAVIFYKPPGYQPTHAHIDVTRSNDQGPVTCALNFTIGGGNSSMVWYWQKIATNRLEYVADGIPAAMFPVEQLAELHSYHVGPTFTLVRTNIPHAIRCGQLARWCVSLRVRHGILKTWEDAVGFFKNVSYTDWGR